jgi:5-methylcytosine-specific restriction endonuclease McrBC GTP-binding regulatory subunit McrB
VIALGNDPTLLVIDEINRADTARAFGELITYVEAQKCDSVRDAGAA